MADTVHMLRGGFALCGKPGPPGHWAAGHKWVHADSDDNGPRSAANCTACLDALAQLTMLPRRRLAAEVVPAVLHDAYRNDATVSAHFHLAMRDDLSLEGVLIAIVQALLAEKATLTAAVLSYAKNAPPPVLHFEGPPPVWLKARALAEPTPPELHLDRELMAAVLAWRAQGRKSKWTTAPSVHLVEVVDRLRERYPDLCAALVAEEKPSDG